jgi:hypothetical protein
MVRNELIIKSSNINTEYCIISFSSRCIHKPEFVKSLTKYLNDADLYFYYDTYDVWYSKGIDGISRNVDETVTYLKNICNKYKYVYCIGASMGGYAAILYGSLIKVNYVLAFIPQTIITNYVDYKYTDLKNIINNDTKYLLVGNLDKKKENYHHISQCERISNNDNVYTIQQSFTDLKMLRNNGYLNMLFDMVFYEKIYINANINIDFKLLENDCTFHNDRDYTYDKIPEYLINKTIVTHKHKLLTNTTFKIYTIKENIIYMMIHNIKHGGLISELIENGWVRLSEPLHYDTHNGNHGLMTTLLQYNTKPNESVSITTTENSACISILF